MRALIQRVSQANVKIDEKIISEIKQGLPLSPYLFLFYINDVFDFMDSIFGTNNNNVFNNLHILIHADDANLIATTRDLMIRKLSSMLKYCKLNSVVLQVTKCFFTAVNASSEEKELLHDGVEYRDYLEILGSHISDSLKKDLALHMEKRFKNVIKYFNYIRANQIAPVSVKLKVLKACVMSTLLYNCETFGPKIPEGLEQLYFKMLRAALGVRSNCPNLLVLIESGCLPLACLIRARQLKFFRRFKMSMPPNSTRKAIFDELLSRSTAYLDHYRALDETYATVKDLKELYIRELHEKVRGFASNKDQHYKYWVYCEMNPTLEPSPFLNRIDHVGKCITKFRLGSHNLKIETGRWYRGGNRQLRDERRCPSCEVPGDEQHAIYHCSDIFRGDLNLPATISDLWKCTDVNTLFQRLRDTELVV